MGFVVGFSIVVLSFGFTYIGLILISSNADGCKFRIIDDTDGCYIIQRRNRFSPFWVLCGRARTVEKAHVMVRQYVYNDMAYGAYQLDLNGQMFLVVFK